MCDTKRDKQISERAEQELKSLGEGASSILHHKPTMLSPSKEARSQSVPPLKRFPVSGKWGRCVIIVIQ